MKVSEKIGELAIVIFMCISLIIAAFIIPVLLMLN